MENVLERTVRSGGEKCCGAVNAIISHNTLSEECYMRILGTQCANIYI